MEFIDVSGIGNSGKSAVVDLLREIDGLFVPEYWFEFDLVRIRGGLLDLRHSLYEDWSPVRSHAAYHEFVSVVKKMGCDPKPWNFFGQVISTGHRYNCRFRGEFQAISLKFVNQFLIGSYRAEWPYDGLRECSFKNFSKRILRRIGFRNFLLNEVMLLDGKEFDKKAKDYLKDLYSTIVPANCDRIILNNGLEPFNPAPGLEMLGARQIIVTRDPRDVYVSGLDRQNVSKSDASLLAFDNSGTNKSFLGTNNLDLFIKRYRLYREHLYKGCHPNVLKIDFENLIINADEVTSKILQFLDIKPSRHRKENVHFIPSRSLKNIGVWRRYTKKEEIRYIESQLGEFLVDFKGC